MINIEQNKWVVIADGKNILTMKGFKPIKEIKYSEVRVFAKESIAMVHIQNSRYSNCVNLTYHNVTIKIKEN